MMLFPIHVIQGDTRTKVTFYINPQHVSCVCSPHDIGVEEVDGRFVVPIIVQGVNVWMAGGNTREEAEAEQHRIAKLVNQISGGGTPHSQTQPAGTHTQI